MNFAARFSGQGQPYEGLAYKDKKGSAHWTGKIMLVEAHLYDPLKWTTPHKVFVNSMSDVYHPDVPFDYIDRMFAVMTLAPQHIFQILTKRPERMLEYMTGDRGRSGHVRGEVIATLGRLNARRKPHKQIPAPDNFEWPLPNVWMGTSAENQSTADARVPVLAKVPAAMRFVSAEPLLGPIDFRFKDMLCDNWKPHYRDPSDMPPHPIWDAQDGWGEACASPIHWTIVGGESGAHMSHSPERWIDLDWARSIRDQCAEASVAFWYKQGSGTRSGMNPILDGREWHEFPVQVNLLERSTGAKA